MVGEQTPLVDDVLDFVATMVRDEHA